jgi:ABC-type phosphate/phosphonate transport system substrate-binding protein
MGSCATEWISGRQFSLPMYPFDELRDATERYWQRVGALLRPHLGDATPPTLMAWSGSDIHPLWHDPALGVSQSCGWPLVTELAGQVRVLGAFTYPLDGPTSSSYRSMIVTRNDRVATDWIGRDVTAAVNNPDSLSGWVSLQVAADGRWPGGVVWTGSHVGSLQALRDGAVDVASIDAVTFAHMQRLRPQLTDGLNVVARGPLVPTLPMITHRDAPASIIELLRQALGGAIDDATTASLLFDDFTPLDAADYGAVADLLA